MLKDIPKGLASTVRSIYEKSVKQHMEQKLEEAQRVAALREASKPHTVPKTDKEKKLAALADDGKKHVITHADVMAGRGVKKEGFEDLMKATKERQQPQPNGGAGKKQGTAYGGSKQKDVKEETTEVVEAKAEQKDTPGQEHLCAVHVKHKTMGEGRTLFSQHADPSEDGSIAWYDVMFEHGIEKKVPTTDLEITVAESHMSHKKAK